MNNFFFSILTKGPNKHFVSKIKLFMAEIQHNFEEEPITIFNTCMIRHAWHTEIIQQCWEKQISNYISNLFYISLSKFNCQQSQTECHRFVGLSWKFRKCLKYIGFGLKKCQMPISKHFDFYWLT